jgi:hypothetical protein
MFWPIATAFCCLLAWGGIVFGPQIIRVATDQGLIEIQSDDPDVQVEVTDGGGRIEVVDLKTKQSLQIKSGTYQIRALGEENSVSIDKEKLTLSRGEKVIVTVTKEVETVAESSVRADNEVKPNLDLLLPSLSLEQLDTNVALRAARVEELRESVGIGHPEFRAAALEVAMLTNALNQRKKEQASLDASSREFTAFSVPKSFDPNHKLQPGDVLSIFIENVLGEFGNASSIQVPDKKMLDHDVGFPVPVQADGTIRVPLISPVNVEGKTVSDVESQLVRIYVQEKNLDSKTRITVALKEKRNEAVAVLSEPVYDGMTFEQCLALVKYERDGAKLIKPLKGLMVLAPEDEKDELSYLIWDAIKRVRTVNIDSYIEQQFFKWCDDELLQRYYLELASSDDSRSWRLISTTLEDSLERLTPIHDRLCLLATKSTGKDRLPAAPVLAMLIKSAKLSPDIRKDAIAVLIGKASVISENQSYFLRLLAETAPDTAGLGKLVGQWILESNVSRSVPKQLILLSPENQKEALPFVTKAAFNFGANSAFVPYLVDVPDKIFEEVQLVYEEQANSFGSTRPQRTAASVLALRQERKRDKKALEKSDL